MTTRKRKHKGLITVPAAEQAAILEKRSGASSSNPKVRVSHVGPEIWEKLPAEANDAIGARIRQRIGRKTLVIIGTSPDTCGLTPWDEPYIDGFWSLNDCHHLPFIRPHLDRITAWFQLHHHWRFSRKAGRYGSLHYDWLREPHNFPIYMQQHYDDVPASVPFPLREVCERYLAGMLGRGTDFQRKYFTSTFGPMVGLALLQGYNRMEFYGMELAQQFEYVVQKPNCEFWLGIAVGNGCQVYVPQKCRMYQGPLYGWRWPDIASAREEDKLRLKQLQELVAKGTEGAKEALEEHVNGWRPDDAMKDDENVGEWLDYRGDAYKNMHIYQEPEIASLVPGFMKPSFRMSSETAKS